MGMKWNAGRVAEGELGGMHQPISMPSILMLILMGKGDIPVALVIRGTAVRPRSDDV